jgi:hypothetical protein
MASALRVKGFALREMASAHRAKGFALHEMAFARRAKGFALREMVSALREKGFAIREMVSALRAKGFARNEMAFARKETAISSGKMALARKETPISSPGNGHSRAANPNILRLRCISSQDIGDCCISVRVRGPQLAHEEKKRRAPLRAIPRHRPARPRPVERSRVADGAVAAEPAIRVAPRARVMLRIIVAARFHRRSQTEEFGSALLAGDAEVRRGRIQAMRSVAWPEKTPCRLKMNSPHHETKFPHYRFRCQTVSLAAR